MDDLLLRINDISSKKSPNSYDLNLILDELIAIFYTCKSPCLPSPKAIDKVLIAACLSESSLLMAKCCQLVHLLETKQKLDVNIDTVKKLAARWVSILNSPDDVCYVDILLALKVLIRKHGDTIAKVEHCGQKIASILLTDLEQNCRLSDAGHVRHLRFACQVVLLPFCEPSQLATIVPSLMKAVQSWPNSDASSHAKMYARMLDALRDVLAGCKWKGSWAEESVGRLLGIAASGILDCQPFVHIPSPAPPLPLQTKNQASTPGSSSKVKKWKHKKPLYATDVKAETGRVENSKSNTLGLELTVTSDSEVSDSESGNIAKAKARLVIASTDLLVHCVKCLDKKLIAGYYLALLGDFERWLDNEQRWSAKSTAAVCAALGAVLHSARPYLAIAQQSGASGAFTAYSEMVALSITSLTNAVCRALCREPTAALLASAATLISVTPYSRLSPKEQLLTNLVSSAVSRSGNSEWDKSLIKFISALLLVNPKTDEQLAIINAGPDGNHQGPDLWIINFICDKFSQKTGLEAAGWWEAAHAAWTGHFDLLGTTLLAKVRSRLASDLRTPDTRMPATDALVAVLAQAASADDDGASSTSVWEWLGPALMGLVAEPSCGDAMALVVCRAMNQVTPQAYFAMHDDVQLLLVTQLLGCARHQEMSVRDAAVSAIGVILGIPDMASERYMLDLSWCVVKACQDDSTAVRCAAAWSLGNLASGIPPAGTKERTEMLSELPLTKLIRVSLDLTKDPYNHIKMNCCRTVGAFFSIMTEEDVDSSCTPLIEEATDFLVSAASGAQFMKIRWNACYAFGNILSNKALYSESSSQWMKKAVEYLCGLLVSSKNFKVRAGACGALTSVPGRQFYNPAHLYFATWTAVLDGFESAAVTPDFSEYRHERLLNNQLCSGVCKLICLLSGEEDLNAIGELLEYREERLTSALGRYLSSDETPDRCGSGVAARQHLLSLSLRDHPTVSILVSALTPAE